MALAGSDSALIEVRSFGRARPGQPGLRRSGFPRTEPAPPPPPPPSLRDLPHPLARRWDRWCCRIEVGLAGRLPVTDLRADIGSRRWFGGAARLVAYALPALLCMPTFSPFEAAPLPLPGDGAMLELRAAAIRPLIAGGGNGRHFAASDLVRRLDSVPERATIGLTAVLGENDDLAHMLQRLGLAPRDADAVRTIAAPLGNPAPGTRFAVTLGPRAATGELRPLAALSYRPRYDLDVTIAREQGRLTLHQRPIPVDATPLHLVGAVGSSLYRAARDAGASPGTVQAYLQAVDQYLPFEAIEPGDQFELVVAHKRALDGSNSAPGEDGALLYAGILRDGKPLLRAMRWGNDGNFFTPEALADSAQQHSGVLLAPVDGNITSYFGMRHHPILGVVRLHAGIDIAARSGSPIYAVTDGVVSYAGWHGGHGNYVRLEHGGGIDTGYGHMSRIAVSAGTRVARGQVIGYVGATGLATGPHLHYELFRSGQPVDPLSIRFIPRHVAVDPHEVALFRARMQQLLALPRNGA